MITICENRYGEGWLAFSCDPEDIDPRYNGGDSEHFAFFRAEHEHPIGAGATPDAALEALRREIARYQSTPSGEYRLTLPRRMEAPPTWTYTVEDAEADIALVAKPLAAYAVDTGTDAPKAADEARRDAARMLLALTPWRAAVPSGSAGLHHVERVAKGGER